MAMNQVRVRRERPAAAAWAIALAVTMLAVYVLTLGASLPDAVESVSAAPRVTRLVELEALEAHCVSMGSWKDEPSARLEAAGYAAQGAAGFVYPMDGAWHVLGAMVDSARAAQRVAGKLKAEGRANAEALEMRVDAVKLRITAPDRQIDAIIGADACVRGQMNQLNAVAMQLDRGEIRSDAARTLCAVGATEAGDAASQLAAIPGAPENALCEGLIGAASGLAEQLNAISKSESPPAALSGMMRLAAVDAFLNLKSIREGLIRG